MTDPNKLKCTGDKCEKRASCPFFNSTAKVVFDPEPGKCDLYYPPHDVATMVITKTLTTEQHAEIKKSLSLYRQLRRQMNEVSCEALAKRYRVSIDTIYKIRRACRL